jgi:hypothetical protein
MSSYTPTSTKSLFSRFPASNHFADSVEPEEKSISAPEPTEQKATWQEGGYTPSRASWHTVEGRIRSYFA